MIVGKVYEGFPRVTLRFGSASINEEVEFIIDTGYDGEVAIPTILANRLGLRDNGHVRSVVLANGNKYRCGASEALLSWGDEPDKLIEVLLLDGFPLLGVQLLQDHSLYADFSGDGEVNIEPV